MSLPCRPAKTVQGRCESEVAQAAGRRSRRRASRAAASGAEPAV